MRTARTLCLSLPPDVVAQLKARGDAEGKTAARVAAEIVLEQYKRTPAPIWNHEGRLRILERAIARLIIHLKLDAPCGKGHPPWTCALEPGHPGPCSSD